MLNFAVIGCGRISIKHCELLGLGLIPGARLVAVSDANLSRAQEVGIRFKIPHYENFNDMLRREDIDVVSILTPSGLHANHVLAVAEFKKHIVVEKPLALSLDDADRMKEACRNQNIELFIVKQNRFNVPIVRLRQELESGRFGKLVMGTVRVRWCRDQAYYDQDDWRGTWSLDGGVFVNQASHHIDLLQWMMGDVESVCAKAGTYLVDIETEDTGVALLKFKNGALGIIEATTACRPKDLEGSLSILGENGSVEIGGFAANEIRHWNFRPATSKDQNVIQNYSVNPPDAYGYGHKAFLNYVVECLSQGKKNYLNAEEGRKSLELIMAIYESVESKKEVVFPFKPSECLLGKNRDR